MASGHRELRDVLGRFATGVAVAAIRDASGATLAMTINSFTSVSLDPPLVLWCVARESATYEEWVSAEAYGVSILGADQKTLGEACARKGPRTLEAPTETWVSGAPILAGALAALDCRMEEVIPAGDHAILLGRVVEHRLMRTEDPPLTFYAGRWGGAPATTI